MFEAIVVDDDFATRTGIVERVPWDLVQCEVTGEYANGADALKAMEMHLPDIVLIDLEMPVMNGMTMLREIRRRGWNTDVIILTCHADFIYAQEAIRLGVFDYVLKVGAFDQKLLDAVKRLLVKRLLAQSRMEMTEETSVEWRGRVLELRIEDAQNQSTGAFLAYKALSENARQILTDAHAVLRKVGTCELILLLPEMAQEEALQFAEKMMQYIRETTHLEVTAGLSKQGCMEPAMETQAHDRAQYGFYFGRGRVYDDDRFSNTWNEGGGLALPMEMISRELPDQQVLENVEGFIESLYGRNPEMVREAVVEWMYALIMQARRKGCVLLGPITDFRRVSKRIGQIHSFDEMKQEIHQAVRVLVDNEIINQLPEAVQMVVDRIKEHPESDESLLEIAQRIGISYCYLSSQFKAEMGTGFTEYRNRIRIEKGKRLLRNGRQSVSEIAELLNYSTPYYFSNVFRRLTGQTPTEYRNQRAEGSDSGRQ